MNSGTMIAMSGGVDSSVAAYLMQQKQSHCGGAIMQLWKEVSSGAIRMPDTKLLS